MIVKADMPPSWFMEALGDFVTACYMQAPIRPGLLSITVDPQLGLRLGIAPNEWAEFSTPVGYVRVLSRVIPR